jgi:hypothetical protein
VLRVPFLEKIGKIREKMEKTEEKQRNDTLRGTQLVLARFAVEVKQAS